MRILPLLCICVTLVPVVLVGLVDPDPPTSPLVSFAHPHSFTPLIAQSAGQSHEQKVSTSPTPCSTPSPNRTSWVYDSKKSTFTNVSTSLILDSGRALFYLQSPFSQDEFVLAQQLSWAAMSYWNVIDDSFGDRLLDIDENDRVIVSFVNIPDIQTAGYFLPANQLSRTDDPDQVRYYSCECEELYLNKRLFGVVDDSILVSKIVHEYANLKHYSYDDIEDIWLMEGFSSWLEWWSGASSLTMLSDYTNPFRTKYSSSSLTYFSGSLADYGAGFWFVDYIYRTHGLEQVIDLFQSPNFSYWALEESLNQSFPSLFHGWVDYLLSNQSIQPTEWFPHSQRTVETTLLSGSFRVLRFSNVTGILNVSVTTEIPNLVVAVRGVAPNGVVVTRLLDSDLTTNNFLVERVRDYSWVDLLVMFPSSGSGGIEPVTTDSIPLTTFQSTTLVESRHDFWVEVPDQVVGDLTLNLTSPQFFTPTSVPSATLTLVHQGSSGGQWINLETIDYTNLVSISFPRPGRYVMEFTLPDGSVGVSNVFTVNHDDSLNGWTVLPLILGLACLGGLVHTRRRDR